ncbi:MAG: hypothetical protein RJA29_1651, partial [Pseudomonadota bacterium]
MHVRVADEESFFARFDKKFIGAAV